MIIEKLTINDLHDLKIVYEDAFEGSSTNYELMVDRFYKISDNPNYIILCAKK
jgi:hypothetical protein